MQTSNLCACGTGGISFVAMVALMLAEGVFPIALVLLVVGAGLMAGVCIFAEWQ